MATLMYMPTEHVPVLATELIDLLDPHPGDAAVDCTFGGGGHKNAAGCSMAGRYDDVRKQVLEELCRSLTAS